METNATSPAPASGLVERVKSILLRPAEEWTRIDGEQTTAARLYKGYVLPLAAIPAVAGLVGSLVFGHSVLGITYQPSIGSALGTAVVQYVLALASVFILALVIDALAPTFNATRDRIQALKVSAYSATAAWVAGIFNLIPAIAFLAILGLYSLYLLYLGLPKLMKAPQEKALPYTAVVIVVAIVIWVIIGALVAPISGLFASSSTPATGRFSAATAQLEQAARDLENSKDIKPVAPDQLAEFVPSRFAGLERTSFESASGSAAGIGGTTVHALYGEGDATASLDVTDFGTMAALASLGIAFNIESERKYDGGYERVYSEKGRMITEEWDENSRHGSYKMVVGNRFIVDASAQGIDIRDLKKAVHKLDLDDLEKLARKR